MSRLTQKSCLAISFTSELARSRNEGILQEYDLARKSHIIYRPVMFPDIEDFGSRSRSTFEIAFVGNAFFRKGGVELLSAFLDQRNDDWRLTIISELSVDWEKFPDLQERSAVRGMIASDPRIKLFQKLDHAEVLKVLSRADVYVGTTYADPWGHSIAEAAACGLPVISSNIGAIPEMVAHGQTGQLIDMSGKTSRQISIEISHHLRAYYDDTTLRLLHGRNARRLAQGKFSIEARNCALNAIVS